MNLMGWFKNRLERRDLKNVARSLAARNKRQFVFEIEIDREEDGRWIAEIPKLPGVMTYGATQEEAVQRVAVLALRVMADRLEHEEAQRADALSFTLQPRECLAHR